MPTLQPMIWAGSELNDLQIEHMNRHLQNAEEFVLGRGLSSYQGERALDIPDELRIDDGKWLNKETKMKWQAYLKQVLPVEADLVMPLEKNGMVQCSCSSVGHDLHSPDCVCPCKYCCSFRDCACTETKCVCPPVCNCACLQCVHDGKPNEQPSQPTCATEGCQNPPKGSRGRDLYCGRCQYVARRDK
jgi:hypothetical protein